MSEQRRIARPAGALRRQWAELGFTQLWRRRPAVDLIASGLGPSGHAGSTFSFSVAKKAATDSMTHRKIRDGDGRAWDVWEVYPAAVERRMSGEFPAVTAEGNTEGKRQREVRLLVPAELQQGWLAFQCGSDRRRLVPIPENWSLLEDEALISLLDRADRVSDGDGR
jgi:hypothetical protein